MRQYLKGRQLLSRRSLPALHEARAEFSALLEALPGFASGWASLAEGQMLLAHYGADGTRPLVEDCERHLEHALALQPNHAMTMLSPANVCAVRGEFADAGAWMEQALRMDPRDGGGDLQWHEYAAMLAGLRGNGADALRHCRQMIATGDGTAAPPWSLARAAAAAGQVDAAIDWLEQAALRRSSSVPFLRITPAFDSLQGHARFDTLADALGLPVASARR